MKRDSRIDFLRMIGILFIVLAHVHPPEKIFVYRMFDVTLMTFLMGMGMGISGPSKDGYISYLWKRFKRLMVPAYVFLLLFFILFNIINIFSSIKYNFTLKNYVGSFSTFSGIGYIWIIRVFFIMSILSPIFIWLSNKIKKIHFKLAFISISLIIQQLLCILVENKNGILYKIISDLFIMSFGYAIITLLGLWVYKQNTKDNLIFTSYFLIIFILLLIKYNFYTMISYKYPPYPFYLSYGFLVSIVLWQLLSFDKIKEKTSNIKCVKWFSTNSMTVYYWHIIPVFYLENYIKDSYLANTWWLAYAAVLGFSILGTILQNNIKIIYKKRIY